MLKRTVGVVEQLLAHFIAPRHRAYGGIITGPGGPRDDVIPALLSNGEFVVNAAATARNRPFLEAINARGGLGPALLAAGGPVGGIGPTMSLRELRGAAA